MATIVFASHAGVSAAIPQQNLKSTVQGTVVNASTNEPIMGAQVTRISLPGEPVPQVPPGERPPPPPTFDTDANGRFTIADLDAGSFGFSVSVPGYVSQSFGGPMLPAQASAPAISIRGGEIKTLTIRMVPLGTIAGRVVDNNRRPLAGVGVQILQPIFDALGRRTVRVAGEGRTNDHGEYRAFWIAPGRYLVIAGVASAAPSTLRTINSSPNEIPGTGVAPTYFAGVPDRSQASVVELKPGAELGGIDFVLPRLQAHRVRGRILDAATGKPPASAAVALATISLDGNGFGRTSNGRNYDAATGTFDLRDVPPGPQFIYAEMADPGVPPLPRVAPVFPTGGGGGGGGGGMSRDRIIASVMFPVNVGDSDIDGLAIFLSPPPLIQGRLTVDGSLASEVTGNLRVQLWPSVDGVIYLNPPGPPPVMVQPDGSFTIDGASPGEYRVAVGGGDPNIYIKDARFGSGDALNMPIKVSVAETSILSLAVSAKSAQLDGTIVDASMQPVPAVRAVLIPNQHRDRAELYRNVPTDAFGHFQMQGIPPGDYKVFAWQSLDPYAYFDPVVLQRYESQGQPVHLLEASRVNIQAPVIP